MYYTFTQINVKTREINARLEEDLGLSNERFDKLRQHAEDKLQEANVEIARVRSGYEKEVVHLRAKVSRLEVKVSGLERGLEMKVKENEELLKICDDLERYFENKE